MEDPFRCNVYYSDAAVMAENMHLMATDMGLGSCLILGTILALGTNKELIKKLNLPEGHVPCCVVIVGGTEEKFPERQIPENKISVSYIG
ncbi:MAG: nitroreductase family protein [Phascolarctobacterium sp.]|nr:nitroreductase family protein [Phascolarctobacterium sp.]